MKKRFLAALLLLTMLALTACSGKSPAPTVHHLDGEAWHMGFASEEIIPPQNASPLYIAGYNNGLRITGVRDYQRASAVWLDAGGDGILLIGIDCVGLSRGSIEKIRAALNDFSAESGCAGIYVWATHTHAGIDTFGLWGDVAIDGKNDAFMEQLILSAANAARAAYERRTAGTLYYGSVATEGILYDSREPYVYDSDMHIFRFEPDDGSDGIRIINYAAHAEALRGDNTLVSRDYPGVMSDIIKASTGDDMLFIPGALGGLIMTDVLCEGEFDAEENLLLTGEALASYVLSDYSETQLSPHLTAASCEFEVPLENTIFMYYRLLGILDNEIRYRDDAPGYLITSEMSLLDVGGITLAMIPGEIFPELVYGGYLTNTAAARGAANPSPLCKIAERYGIDQLLVCSLAGDELGYIVPPNDYLVSTPPYLNTVTDAKGENHYEETNSTGRDTARIIAETFEALAAAIQ